MQRVFWISILKLLRTSSFSLFTTFRIVLIRLTSSFSHSESASRSLALRDVVIPVSRFPGPLSDQVTVCMSIVWPR